MHNNYSSVFSMCIVPNGTAIGHTAHLEIYFFRDYCFPTDVKS